MTALEAENRTLKLELEAARSQVKTAVDAGSTQCTFVDLKDAPAASMINELKQLGVFAGEGNSFKPNQAITRAEYCHWLFNAYNALMPEEKQIRLNSSASQFFSDCAADHPLYPYVQALAAAGYSIGYEDKTFHPDQPLTREEMLGIKLGVDVGKTLDPWRSQMEAVWKFSDGKEVAERFTGYVHQDYYVSGPHGSNIQRAFGKIGALHPKQSVLRGEAAATLWQFGQFGFTQNTTAACLLKSKTGKET
ncbi:MAG: S-layer homology domain-containing protein [Candidatus Obscuribacterales bacterium]|nr:S-layer homology domain-containing protein [Candidatus Obscuribacterales bacterium]